MRQSWPSNSISESNNSTAPPNMASPPSTASAVGRCAKCSRPTPPRPLSTASAMTSAVRSGSRRALCGAGEGYDAALATWRMRTLTGHHRA